MKRIFLVLLSGLIAGLWSCNTTPESKTKQKVVTVTILPQQYLINQLAGDKFRVNVLIPEDANHETYEPTARQMVETGNSFAYFKLGLLDVEKSWLENICESNPELKVYITSTGIDLIKGDAHKHGDHSHEGGIDPHIWLSVSTMRIQAENIATSLTEIDPENKEYYLSRYNKLLLSLDSLDSEIKHIFSSAGTKSFMIFHPSLGYFARDYNLEQIPIEEEGKEPSPAYMRQLIDIAREKEITTIFISSQFNNQSAVTIAHQLNARVEEFNPSSPDWSNNMRSIAQKLAGTIKK
jgi:zinc transport system substrate-binding protein